MTPTHDWSIHSIRKLAKITNATPNTTTKVTSLDMEAMYLTVKGV